MALQISGALCLSLSLSLVDSLVLFPGNSNLLGLPRLWALPPQLSKRAGLCLGFPPCAAAWKLSPAVSEDNGRPHFIRSPLSGITILYCMLPVSTVCKPFFHVFPLSLSHGQQRKSLISGFDQLCFGGYPVSSYGEWK